MSKFIRVNNRLYKLVNESLWHEVTSRDTHHKGIKSLPDGSGPFVADFDGDDYDITAVLYGDDNNSLGIDVTINVFMDEDEDPDLILSGTYHYYVDGLSENDAWDDFKDMCDEFNHCNDAYDVMSIPSEYDLKDSY